MKSILITNARVINEGKSFIGEVLIHDDRIAGVGTPGSTGTAETVIDATGKWLLPGLIDDQVHFREPGLTHKGEIYTEAKAAVAGGITSYMEMPNTNPQTLTQELLEAKYNRASEVSLANYSFYMGVSNHNLPEVLKTDPSRVCGVKVFMGSSTGDMLVDNPTVLEKLFAECSLLIATHCEDEATVKANMAAFRERFGEDIPVQYHPLIRNEEACYKSSSLAVSLAEKHGTRLHILHISTARETGLFRNDIPLREKRITAEACVHHLWFCDQDYAKKGNFIKWNPAIKTAQDREAIREAVRNGTIDVLATDHAPHTLEEKQNTYFKAPAGGPLVQHALPALLEMAAQGVFSPEQIVQSYCHNVAECFRLKERGYIRPGYFADLVLVNPNRAFEVRREDLLYKSGWSPFEGDTFSHTVEKTWVNGHLAWDNGHFNESEKGRRLTFEPVRR